ncbi:MAG: hypothetical protein KDA74_17560, partial [Planctomycetaceae bacterium]|nr:hypothetical protein [Planctomycetaceae bacterium]
MNRQFFLPAFWATLTGLSLLLIAAMTDVKTPQSLFISPQHSVKSQLPAAEIRPTAAQPAPVSVQP